MSAKSKNRRRKVSLAKRPSLAGLDQLDKGDEVWCYVLVKMFTAMLDDPEEAERLLESRSPLDVDLEPAARQLAAALDRQKQNCSSAITESTVGDRATQSISSTAGSSSGDFNVQSSSSGADLLSMAAARHPDLFGMVMSCLAGNSGGNSHK